MAKNTYVEVKTNIPEYITPKFSSWKMWENDGVNGKYKSYSIGVEWRGVDAYFSVGEGVYKAVFEPLGNLQDRSLEVLKYEDGKYKKWKVLENGQDITPKASPNAQNAPQTAGKPQTIPDTPAQPRPSYKAEFAKIDINIQKLVKKILELEADIEGLKGALINDDNLKSFEFHKGVSPQIKEKVEKMVEPPQEKGYEDIPIVNVDFDEEQYPNQ